MPSESALPRHPFGGVPNLLSLSRLPLSVVLFVCISYAWWAAALAVFSVAMFTDWLDGWWARRYGPLSPIGRSLDPLTDKVIIGGAFIYFLLDPRTGLMPWMVTVIISRELLITGLRGIVESLGKSFGADWFGKLKTVLQSAVVIGVLLLQTLRSWPEATGVLAFLEPIQAALLYAMLAATIGSAVQYTVKAVRLLKPNE
ncbi:MAG: CDP-diacylglycerol--glycerol-3-phosphate 3-phosphatidyltransferase [Bacteroidales bacterium]|nr:CDP-diacylglycerol--glycerol-3-phosphate 3-phosphatidyltransferase [Bacteroidales bacterium]